MKIKSDKKVTSDKWQVTGCKACHPSPVTGHSQRGIALIITLILLSVTLIMAVAFLAISRRERGSVTTATDTATARLAADSALANAQAQIIASIFATTNPYNSSLLVSTNYINPNGFQIAPPALYTNLINVSYNYPNGTPLSSADFEQNVANLFLSPRAPVFITDRTTGTNDFRFYLDLNRNGNFEDTSGSMPQTNNFGQQILDANNNPINVPEIGDPQWIGVLERPDAPHGPNNKFLSRYAFVCLPAGGALDLNAIHNNAYTAAPDDGYFRDQGVGSWEINLAAFLTDLNTNEWGQVIGDSFNGNYTYYYYQYAPNNNRGLAFYDANELLAYRYNFNPAPWASAQFANNSLANGPVDIFPFGPAMTNTFVPFYSYSLNIPWAGADNTNHFFDLTADLFDTTKTERNVIAPALGFTDHLLNAGTNTFGGSTVSTYDRYTFYRLLAQLGTDSTPESGKMNLNYDNLDNNGNVVPGAETNLNAWTTEPNGALRFFTFAADRMLRLYTTNWYAADFNNFTNTFGTNAIPFGITNIPVWANGRLVYSSAVNRLLQLAANMYDATTNSFFPSVFRPLFSTDAAGNLFITSYTNIDSVAGINIFPLVTPFDARTIAALPNLVNVPDNIYGVPWIIGAKKGFPNFNELSMQSGFQLTRKLQMTRTSPTALLNTYKVNQMFNISVTNQLGVECWNSYSSNYTRPVNIFVTDIQTMALTNDEGFIITNQMILTGTNINPTTVWPGYNTTFPVPSFQIPLNTNAAFVPVSMYRFNGGSPFLSTNLSLPYETNVLINGSAYPYPTWGLAVTNNLQVVMMDVISGRIIDYVQLSGPNSSINMSAEIQQQYGAGNTSVWSTNLSGQNIPYGLANQINISLGNASSSDFPTGQPGDEQNEDGIDGFRAFYGNQSQKFHNPEEAQIIAKANSTNATQLPYNPTATIYQHTTWQANDPLIHYLASDLTVPTDNEIDANYKWPGNLGALNVRYFPWGNLSSADTNRFNMALKDPQIIPSGGTASSDNWDFPTNKFPTVGWLGRVHRGTPWQTVYLKASGVNANGWSAWTGDLNLFDATNMVPGKDRLLFDLFTTELNDNATRGRLSVNAGANGSPSLAAWSAVFSGLVVPTNRAGGYTVISPAGPAGTSTNFPMGQLVTGINNTRATLTNADGVAGTFEHVGDVLRTPQLTEQSPFLTPFFNSSATNGFNDELYEWLPQQTMGLLTVSTTPRYVIYSYGQTLKPAQNGIDTASGTAIFGMVTNYQVVSEIATRAVVRVNTVLTTNTSNTVTTNYSTTVEQFNILPPD
jgi:hypothetical protein